MTRPGILNRVKIEEVIKGRNDKRKTIKGINDRGKTGGDTMGRMKKMVGLLSLTVLLTIAMSVPAFAAKKI